MYIFVAHLKIIWWVRWLGSRAVFIGVPSKSHIFILFVERKSVRRNGSCCCLFDFFFFCPVVCVMNGCGPMGLGIFLDMTKILLCDYVWCVCLCSVYMPFAVWICLWIAFYLVFICFAQEPNGFFHFDSDSYLTNLKRWNHTKNASLETSCLYRIVAPSPPSQRKAINTIFSLVI